MAKEIVVWCDPCLGEDQRTPSREYRLAVGTVTKTVDLCEEHYKSIVQPVEGLLEEYGAPVEVAPAARSHKGPKAVHMPPERLGAGSNEGRQQMLLMSHENGIRHGRRVENRHTQCLWCPLDYANDSGSGFGRHLVSHHGITERLRVFSGTCPLCGKEDITLMGSHIGKSHAEFGFKSVTEAFVWARENGDPHGAYATVLAKATK